MTFRAQVALALAIGAGFAFAQADATQDAAMPEAATPAAAASTDVAPTDVRSSFLGVWRLSQDLGESVGPLVIAAGAVLGSLAGGIWVAASLGAASSAALGRWVPQFSVHANATTRRRAGLL